MNWRQFQAIIWLRWRLTRNQFIRGGKLNAALSVVFLAIMLLAGAGLCVGGFLLGWLVCPKVPPQILMLIWDGVVFVFLIFWMSGLMIGFQRSESVDLTKLLHLPVTLRQVFVFNYAASHFTPSIVLLVPGMLGFSAGLAVGIGPGMALLGPVALGLIFTVTAWTYCLRGWLTALMINKRRRRAILLWITIAFVVLGQTPNLLFNSRFFREKQRAHRTSGAAKGKSSKDNDFVLSKPLIQAHLALPPGWPGYSALELRENSALPALGATAASCLLGMLGLSRAYRMTMRFYRGSEHSTQPERVVRAQSPEPQELRPRKPLLVERRLPWLPEDAAALTLATLRSLLRAPEMKIALILPIIMGVILLSLFVTRSRSPLPFGLSGMAGTLAVLGAVFCLVPTMSNVFGLDRDGFRALVLLPTQRRHILLAKNLAFLPFIASATVALLAVVKLVVGISWSAFLAGLMQAPAAFLLFSLLGNYASILVPYRLAQGTLQARKPKATVILASLGSFLVLPIILLPIMIPTFLKFIAAGLGWPSWLPVELLATTAVLAGVIWLYHGMLPVQGRLLQRREQKILREVTEEME